MCIVIASKPWVVENIEGIWNQLLTIYHLEERTEVIPWREVTPEMIAKYEKFKEKCVNDYKMKMNNPDVVYVTQNN